MRLNLRLALMIFLVCAAALGLTVINRLPAADQKFESFSPELEKFPSELHALIRNDLTKDEEAFIRDFTILWPTEFFSEEQKQLIVNNCNNLLKKNPTTRRPFISLVKILVSLQSNEMAKKHFDSWNKGFRQFIENPSISIAWIDKFLANAHALFTKNTLQINPAYDWLITPTDYSIHFDTTLTYRFKQTNLICRSDKDSISIQGTQGAYYPIYGVWHGKGGKVTWIRSQFPENEIFATLSYYRIDLSRNDYQADSVLFTNKDYFDRPVLGKLKDKVLKSSRPENIYFPEFTTYTTRHKIPNLFDGVDYDGGYYMMGGQLIGTGTRTNPAVIEIKRQGKDFLRIEALQYIFRRQVVVSNFARARFKVQTDSIFHIGLGFSYNDQTQTVSLYPTDLLTTKSPMSSSYHKFAFTFNELSWNIKSDILNFGAPTGSSSSRSYFESNNFFNEVEFDDLMGRDEQHPLLAIAQYTRNIKSREFDARGFARYVRKSEEQTRIMLMRIAMMGYIYYDSETGEAQAVPKLFDAIRARGRQIDYDVIRFNSSSPDRTPNAVLNLANLEMTVKGVDDVSVSDSQNVFFFPKGRQIVLKKDRNFAFDGVIRAGLLTLFGRDFNFDYASFSFKLNSIDSMNIDFQTDQFDFYGKKILNQVTSTIETITGEVYIDKPHNKSGLVKNKEYPIFVSTRESFVFYDDKTIHNGIYNRENFYFKVFPFTFKSINTFSQSDMQFEGILYSADIFAPIKDTLVLRPDNSLGIINTTPAEGIAIYQGKGRFFNRIDLSNMGLRGRGEIAYITSKTTSDDFYFFPDSMGTFAKSFYVARHDKAIEYPEVNGKEHIVKWQPYADKLFAFRGDFPFDIFSGETKLTGSLVLDPLGLVGKGLMDLKKARLRSNEFAYNALDFYTPSASLEMDVPGTDRLAMVSNLVQANISFKTRSGEFKRVNESIFANLQGIEYSSHLDRFVWNMDGNELTLLTSGRQKVIEMEKFYISRMADRDTVPAGSLYYSTRFPEDSLYFFAPRATYNLSNPNLKADSVRYLLVADAVIHPYRQKVEVDAQKRIMPLRQSVIYANQTNRFHRIYNSNITISSRKQYVASGTTDYIDELDSIQKVFFKEITTDSKGNTFAKTVVTEPDSFKLSPNFRYTGNIELYATDRFWTFAGGAQPIQHCKQIRSSWLRFTSTINPKNVLIPITEKPINLNMVNLLSGSIVSSDSIHLYPSLVSGRKFFSDKPLIPAEGIFTYNHRNNRFFIGPEYKLNNPDTTGNVISLSKDMCLLFGEGVINLPVNLGQIKNFASGSSIHRLADSTITIDAVLSLNFHFNQVSLAAMASDILATSGLGNVDLNSKSFFNYINLRANPKDAANAINQIKLFGNISQSPEELASTITFSDVRFRWDQRNRSFVSVGKLGINALGINQVNKRVDGFIEIIKRSSGDWITIFIKPSPDKYYFFYYVRGSMQVGSHSSLFTDPIKQMKSRDRKVKVKLGQIPYNFTIGTKREHARLEERYNDLMGVKKEEQQANPEEENNE